MRSHVLYFLLFFSPSFLVSQINVGTKNDIILTAGKIAEEMHQEISEIQAYFILRQSDEEDKALIASILDEVWTVSNIDIITKEEACQLPENEKYLFMEIDESITKREEGEINTDGTRKNIDLRLIPYHHLHLWIRGDKQPYGTKEARRLTREKKELHTRYDKRTLGRVEMHSTVGYSVVSLYDSKNYDIPCLDSHMDQRVFKNWNPGFLKNYLQEINRRLMNEETRFLYAQDQIDGELLNLKSETLYVPEYAFGEVYLLPSRKQRRSQEQEGKKLFDNYAYAYQVVPEDELSNKILTEEEPFYYLSCIRNNYGTAFYSVINSKTGVVVYSDYKHKRSNFHRDDVEKLSNTIGSL